MSKVPAAQRREAAHCREALLPVAEAYSPPMACACHLAAPRRSTTLPGRWVESSLRMRLATWALPPRRDRDAMMIAAMSPPCNHTLHQYHLYHHLLSTTDLCLWEFHLLLLALRFSIYLIAHTDSRHNDLHTLRMRSSQHLSASNVRPVCSFVHATCMHSQT